MYVGYLLSRLVIIYYAADSIFVESRWIRVEKLSCHLPCSPLNSNKSAWIVHKAIAMIMSYVRYRPDTCTFTTKSTNNGLDDYAIVYRKVVT